MRALIPDPLSAVGAGPTRSARAGVRALSGIPAGGAILARFMGSAKVQILVAE